jgi:nicotinamide mononucleotide transporter
VGTRAGWIATADINWLEVFAVFSSYSCTYLSVKQRRINYPIGAISSAAYAYLFWQSGLLASTVLNAYLVPTLVYGWIRWRKDAHTRPVTHIRPRMIPVYLLVAGLGYAGAALLSKQFGGTMAWTDSIILAGTILAQFLLDNKKLENWLVWAVVNVFAIYTYATSGLPLVAFQYVFFLANTVYGYVMWNRSKRHVQSIRTADRDAANYGAPATDTVR